MDILHRSRVIGALVTLVFVTVLSACGAHAAVSGAQGASAAKSNISAVATSPAVIKAKQQAVTLVVNPCKPKLPSLTGFRDCAEQKLGIEGDTPAATAKRGALGTCLFEAAAADHVLTKAGRLKFEEVGGPDCISQILLANGAQGGTGPSSSASPSPTASKT